jgi:hypothetical protein
LVFDVWNGPTVLRERPSERVKIAPTSSGKILRAASGELDVARHACTVRYRLWELEQNVLVDETHEEHRMRFFFPRELELYLHVTGFELVRLGAFTDFDRDPTDRDWNVLTVARAV